MNNSEIKELCDVVFDRLIVQLRKEISENQKKTTEKIAEKVVSMLKEEYSPLISQIFERLGSLETEICYIDKEKDF